MKLLEQLTVVAQRLRLAPNTIKVYQSWVKHFMTFSAAAHGGWKHPAELGTADVEAFLNDLVVPLFLCGNVAFLLGYLGTDGWYLSPD